MPVSGDHDYYTTTVEGAAQYEGWRGGLVVPTSKPKPRERDELYHDDEDLKDRD